jgi:opacity protein-like surface antigen
MERQMKLATPLLMLALSLSAYSHAEQNTGFYLGIKGGNFMVDVSEPNFDYDDATSMGLLAGYDFGSNVSAEFEYNSSNDADVRYFGSKFGTLKVNTFAGYMAYRLKPNTSNGFYVKAKAGILSEDVKVTHNKGTISTNDTGLSLGVGAGFNITDKVALEAEYTLIEQDVNYLSAGLNFKSNMS